MIKAVLVVVLFVVAAQAEPEPNLGCDKSKFTHSPGKTLWNIPVDIVKNLKLASANPFNAATPQGDATRSVAEQCTMLVAKGFNFADVVGAANKGNLKDAYLAIVTEDVPIYRAYIDKAGDHPCVGYVTKDATQTDIWKNGDPSPFGTWWGFHDPSKMTRGAYGHGVGVCQHFNDFTRVVKCTLKKGSAIFIGNTQSVDCTTGINNALSATNPKAKDCAAIVNDGKFWLKEAKKGDKWIMDEMTNNHQIMIPWQSTLRAKARETPPKPGSNVVVTDCQSGAWVEGKAATFNTPFSFRAAIRSRLAHIIAEAAELEEAINQ